MHSLLGTLWESGEENSQGQPSHRSGFPKSWHSQNFSASSIDHGLEKQLQSDQKASGAMFLIRKGQSKGTKAKRTLAHSLVFP